ncbi:hypothetical protein QBC41DRAFT_117590 [Cercophora samala]|uniref:Kelch repeat protein n=1 Tax=Cercophora samala TaxID=330535 RepID=A0AA39ZEB3_9PEZI|nr:hypothetical protein QBC41DRAFT_117590 [Cercophora samala]
MTVKLFLVLWSLLTAKISLCRRVGPRQADGDVDDQVFLRRAFHSSAVFNGWVYIDGGEFSYKSGSNIAYQYSNTLLSIDLSKDWSNDTINIQSSPKPDGVPNLRDGGIWVDEKNGVLYTGFAGTESFFGDGALYPQGLWSFVPNGSGGGDWRSLNDTADPSFVDLPRPYKGQTSSGDGQGYFLGGFVGNETGRETTLSNLNTYDFATNKLTNLTVSGVSTRGLEQYGGMLYVPNFGNRGILINVGGDQDGRVEADDLISFRRVQVYDPETQTWFEQKTSGNNPQPRKQFCMAGMASNNHTYELLIYAGWEGQYGTSSLSYDSAYVLTLPGFYWVKANYSAQHPRHGLTCNPVGGSQVLIIGGVDTTQQNDNSNPQQQQPQPRQQQQQQPQQNGNSYNRLDYISAFNTTDPFKQGLAIFDLHTMGWNTSYIAKPAVYAPAPQVQDYYNTRGLKPEAGFVSADLERIFSIARFDNDPDAASSTNYARRSNAGAIAGGVVGGVVGLAAVFGLFMCFKRRRAEHQREPSNVAFTPVTPPKEQSLPSTVVGQSISTYTAYDKPPQSTSLRRQELAVAGHEQPHPELPVEGHEQPHPELPVVGHERPRSELPPETKTEKQEAVPEPLTEPEPVELHGDSLIPNQLSAESQGTMNNFEFPAERINKPNSRENSS